MHGLKPGTLCGWLLSTMSFMEPAQANSGCAVRLGPSAIDFGAATRGQLLAQSAPGDALSLGLRRVQVNVQCERLGPLRLELIGPAADAAQYRFGPGTLKVRVVAVRVDGKPAQWLSEGDGPDAHLLRPGVRLIPALAGVGIEGLNMEVELELDARIPSAASRVSDLTRLETELGFRMR
ncbi:MULTISPECIES: hypothetical protein [unclassified Pseudomonas]|uniref:hypothetical protein n=1 Tax=unclassified Pseudomonas TaxID=196821 RepID=UPI000A1EA950|nr:MULTISPECIES: hypothetical protein [unclassified Pseudomonas]MDI2141269.1 hypothetical protein [Pseudomonas sp. ITA]